MPRRPRSGSRDIVFHVLNRGVRRQQLFFDHRDYEEFEYLIWCARARYPLRILTYCVMPNHFHAVLWPREDGELSAFMHWLTGMHAQRWHARYGTSGTGAVYQGRFKAIPVQTGPHFLAVCRYVERNALRAGLVSQAEDWPWSGLHRRQFGDAAFLEPWPVPEPPNWVACVNAPDPQNQLLEIRQAITRSRPVGEMEWAERIAARLGRSTVDPREKRRPYDQPMSAEAGVSAP